MARKQVSRKRRVKKNIENGVAHIRSTFNNTIVTITDEFGNALSWSSAGALGFKGSKNQHHSQLKWLLKLFKICNGTWFKTVEVTVKGPGPGRESAIRALQSAGLEVTAIRDVTPVPHNGCRPPKRRRV